jgi:hypothetical protein
MMEPSDIRAGLAVGTAGLLCLAAWVWRDATDRNVPLRAVWVILAVATLGLGALPYLVFARKANGHPWKAAVAWILWIGLFGGGSLLVTTLARDQRMDSTVVIQEDPDSAGPRVPNPSWGAFGQAYPGSPSKTGPAGTPHP